jgi:hypothetical protein
MVWSILCKDTKNCGHLKLEDPKSVALMTRPKKARRITIVFMERSTF